MSTKQPYTAVSHNAASLIVEEQQVQDAYPTCRPYGIFYENKLYHFRKIRVSQWSTYSIFCYGNEIMLSGPFVFFGFFCNSKGFNCLIS